MKTNKRVKILQVIGSMFIGGAEKVVSELSLNLDKSRYDVQVCCIKKKGIFAEKLEKLKIPVHLLATENNNKRYSLWYELSKYLKRNRFEIMHSHGTTAFLEAFAASLLNRQVTYFHTFHYGNYPVYPKKYLFGERIASKIPNHLIAVSQQQRKQLIKCYHIRKDRISTIYNGISNNEKIGNDLTIIEKKRELKIKKDEIVFGTVAVFSEQKGLSFFVDAARNVISRHRNVKFVIVGDGKIKNQIENQIKTYGLEDQIILTGWRTDVDEMMLMFDAYIMSSLWEGMSIVLLEAMAAGKPIVATRVGDNEKIIQQDVNGYLVQPGDAESLSKVILEKMTDKAKLMSMGQNAYEAYRSKYSIDIMVHNYDQLYRSHLNHN